MSEAAEAPAAPVQCGQPGCCAENPVVDETGAPAKTTSRAVQPEEPSEEHPIAARLRAALDADLVTVVDESDGCGAKLQIVVVSKRFEGKPLLAQHRLVNAAAKDELGAVHAFNLKTYTPAKWAAKAPGA